MYRQVSSETGDAQTVVTDEHGRTKTFSQETAAAVLSGAFLPARVLPGGSSSARASASRRDSVRDDRGQMTATGDESAADVFDEGLMRRWIGSLSKHHLKGFDQELRIRLSKLWTEYSKLQAEHEDHLENADYIFFGLDKDATLKDLEKSYRRLAKRMHPDKNGGSEEAKARFQELKDRYEALKKKIQSKAGDVTGADQRAQQKELLDEGQEYQEESEHEDNMETSESEDAYDDEGSEDAAVESDLDRDSMEHKIWEVLGAARKMQRQMRAWREQLEHVVQAK